MLWEMDIAVVTSSQGSCSISETERSGGSNFIASFVCDQPNLIPGVHVILGLPRGDIECTGG